MNGIHLGGCDSTYAAHNEGRLAKILNSDTKETQETIVYDYDLVVIGGGSGGLACSKVIFKHKLKHKPTINNTN